jgi:hypothetical protein
MSAPYPEVEGHTPGEWKAERSLGWVMASNPHRHGPMHVADVRGWGHLTGVGACKMPQDKAAKIQDATLALLALAPTAPHLCSLPGCEGNRNRERLQAAEEMALAIRDHWTESGLRKALASWDAANGR